MLARDSERTGAAVDVVVSWPNSDMEAKEEDEAVEAEVPLMVGGRGINKDKAGVVDLMDALEMESLFVMGRGSNNEEAGADWGTAEAAGAVDAAAGGDEEEDDEGLDS